MGPRLKETFENGPTANGSASERSMLDGLFNIRSDSHHLRSDTCGLEYIDSFATILFLQVFIKVRTRTETSDENDALDDVSSVFSSFFWRQALTLTESFLSLILRICPSTRFSISAKDLAKGF